MAGSWQVLQGDCLDVLRTLDDAGFDSIVTDPPYSLEFMGKAWDSHDAYTDDPAFGYYLAGLIDGEGCFRVQRHERGTHTCVFSMKLRHDDRTILERAKRWVNAGIIRRAEGSGNASPTATWIVQDKDGCQRLVDVLDKYPLRAKKYLDYAMWRTAVCEWTNRPRGNRWAGQADQTAAAALKAQIESNRLYADPPWSGNGYQDWCRMWARECLRVLAPGGYLVAFGGTRTYHRMACAIEDAGFEIRDSLHYIYGNGFPKSKNLDGDWKGWGSTLKPAHEPVVLARKPLAGTLTSNVAKYGTGALNIDGCRVGTDGGAQRQPGHVAHHRETNDCYGKGLDLSDSAPRIAGLGRWPPNVILTHSPDCGENECAEGCPVAELDRQSGTAGSNARADKGRGMGYHGADGERGAWRLRDSGGASRFFPVFRYNAKASKKERPVVEGVAPHPTVKPVALMRWLVKLVTPPGGYVLDPFGGTGTTAEACVLEGFDCTLIERDPDYVKLINERMRKYEDQ